MKQCTAEGCETGAVAKGLCGRHYYLMKRHGSTDSRPRKMRGTCSIEGCDRPHVAFGRCDRHYRKEYRPRPPVIHGERSCVFCGGPIPEKRNVRAMFCSTTCKNKEHVATGKAQQAARRHYFKKAYGLTLDDIQGMLERQGGRCAICRTAEWGGKHHVPYVDHDHSTGIVRGLLCSECNYGLGKFRDNRKTLEAAIAYLDAASLEGASPS